MPETRQRSLFARCGWLIVALIGLAAACTPATPTPPPPELLAPKLLATVFITPTPVSTQEIPPTWTPTATPTRTPVVPTRTATMTPYVGVFLGDGSAPLVLPTGPVSAVVEITLQPLIGGPVVEAFTPIPPARPTATGVPQGVVTGLLSPFPQPTHEPGAEANCETDLAEQFLAAYNSDPAVYEQLGCPTAAAGTYFMAEQAFERGRMFWRETGEIFALASGEASTLWRVQDTWQEGQPESDAAFAPPPGLIQPVRGFGLAWRTNSAIRDGIGWATAPERGFNGTWQPFSGGLMAEVGSGIYVLFLAEGAPTGQYVGPFAGGVGGFAGP